VVEVEQLPDFKPPTDIVAKSSVVAETNKAKAAPEPPLLVTRRDRSDEKPGLLARVNPRRWFGEDSSGSTRATPPAPAERSSFNPAAAAARPVASNPPRVVSHYPYRKNLKLNPGNRFEAQKWFLLGVEAHSQKRLAQAVDYYRQAVASDPTFYDANYNLALAAFQTKDLPLALAAGEQAVTANPKSQDARYNFALTLREANYPADAAGELRKVVAENPDDVRAHLALANLYAQQLDEPALARRHYNRVLELNPDHREAPLVRQWLVNNP
jgi:tetratricopeptide (TPR) repeat protein